MDSSGNHINQLTSPVKNADRQTSLDFIRGIAIFGILVMNIQLFGNVFASYINPTINGDFEGINRITWFITHIFFEQKFYTIFSMLFGAGIVLMAEKSEQSSRSVSPLHYRRSVLLIMFGLAHGFFIWYGDILTIYGICALWVFWFRNASPLTLLITGLLLSFMVSLMLVLVYFVELAPEDIAEIESFYMPTNIMLEKEVSAFVGSWEENQVARVNIMLVILENLLFLSFRIAGCMLMGMALFKWGVINGKKSLSFYKKLTLNCLIIGIVITSYGAYLLDSLNFNDAITAQTLFGQINFLASILVAIGYVGLFQWLYAKHRDNWLSKRFEAVGQMAFTNYIMQSVICTFIFYGYGLGLFASLTRFEMVFVALVVFSVQLMWSKWWLSKFNFGPLEWLWRSLTYLKIQPLIKAN